MNNCQWLTQEVIEDVSAFYVEEMLTWSDLGLLGTMGDYGRICLGVFHGYAEDHYPHLAGCDRCSTALATLVKGINSRSWLEQRPQLMTRLGHLLT